MPKGEVDKYPEELISWNKNDKRRHRITTTRGEKEPAKRHIEEA